MSFTNVSKMEFVGRIVPHDELNDLESPGEGSQVEDHTELQKNIIKTIIGISQRFNHGVDAFVFEKSVHQTNMHAVIENTHLIDLARADLQNIDALVNKSKEVVHFINKETNNMQWFWASVESMENVLEFLVMHVRHIQHTPDVCTNKSDIISP